MNDETTEETLQNDPEISTIIIEDEAIEKPTESAAEEAKPELTPDEAEAEKKTKAQEAFNKQYGKAKQAERERDALQVQLDEIKQSQNQPPPEVGSYPNELDFDNDAEFEAAKTQHMQAIVATANYNAQIEARNNQLQVAQVAAQQQQQNADNEMASKSISRAKSDNITEAEIQLNAQAIINYGMQPDVFRTIMQDDVGHLMMKHLAANSQEVANLGTMNPVQAGAYIATVLKPKALALKPKTSNTPDPATEVQGSGADPEKGKYPFADRATFS